MTRLGVVCANPDCKQPATLILMEPTAKEESEQIWICDHCMHYNKIWSRKSVGLKDPPGQ